MTLKRIFLNPQSYLFMGSQFAAGILNYLFQILASRTLNTVDFGLWSEWLAQFSVSTFIALWLQSLSSMGEVERILSLRRSRGLLLLLIGLISSALFWEQHFLIYILGWLLTLLSGVWFGVHLRRKNMLLLALATLTTTGAKFAWVLISVSEFRFYHATALAPLFACMFYLFFTRSPDSSFSANLKLQPRIVLASVSLAFFSAWVPQMDLLVAPKLLSDVDTGIFAKVALLNKGFFFSFQILAQLLLSHQVAAQGRLLQTKHFLFLTLLGLGAALINTSLAGIFGLPLGWAALSVLHITTLCLLFLMIQSFAAAHQWKLALALSLSSVFLALSASWLKVQIEFYWMIAVVFELIVGALLFRKSLQSKVLSSPASGS